MNPSRPVLRYHGGKWRLAPWIIGHFGPHKVYTEAFGGAASVLLRKLRAHAEVYNDLDGEVVNLFRVLRNPSKVRELIRLIALTPYAREEFELSWIAADDPIERARRTLFRSAAGHSPAGQQSTWGTGFRGNATRRFTIPATDWANLPIALEDVVERLQGVIIENRPAAEVLREYDGPQMLHYVDPPYCADTRNRRWVGQAYRFEMSDDQHVELAQVLHALRGQVVLSGYSNPLYESLYADWRRCERATHADSGLDRIEVLWLSSIPSGMLFGA